MRNESKVVVDDGREWENHIKLTLNPQEKLVCSICRNTKEYAKSGTNGYYVFGDHARLGVDVDMKKKAEAEMRIIKYLRCSDCKDKVILPKRKKK